LGKLKGRNLFGDTGQGRGGQLLKRRPGVTSFEDIVQGWQAFNNNNNNNIY
jgi:hypothetical protein